MTTGTVKWFDTTKGFGFIQPEQGSDDILVHTSAVERTGIGNLDEGQKLSPEAVRNPRRGKVSAESLCAL
ncbi:cold-shock protein [Azospirillum himalayense]|uniref:Cold-shock protein n=1 Tax=Azospirillum himalayense TaxID=654847 RepID=A0ABW0G2R2_9PROT